MTKWHGRVLATATVVAGLAALITVPATAPVAQPAGDIPAEIRAELQDSYIFVFDRNVGPASASARAANMVARQGGTLQRVYTTAIRGFAARMPAQAAARLAAQNPEIAYYEADGVVYAIGQPAPGGVVVAATPQVTPYGITRVGGPVAAGRTGRTAWVIDTGVDFKNPDLNVDTGRSVTFARGSKTGNDDHGHGTHVAGTIAAMDNMIDVVGVAAGATVVAVKVLSRSGSGTISGVIAGIDYVAANAATGDVANMSLGGGASTALDDAVRGAANLGVRFAIAAGNSGADANNFSPARVNHPNVYTVSAIDVLDRFASFSNWGNPPVDFAAPGVNVLSSAIGGGTVTFSGTSMATPHVAGILLLADVPSSDRCAIGDPDGNPDPIAHITGGVTCLLR